MTEHQCQPARLARRRVLATQNVSRMCLVCGTENILGLRGRFYVLEPEPGTDDPTREDAALASELLGVFTPRQEHQSYPGRLHGGIAAAVLDETIGRAVIMRQPQIWGVTAELTLRYRKPLPLDRELRVLGRITRDGSRLFEGSGEIVLDDGSVAVEAHGKYLKMSIEAITDEAFPERDWFADAREHPSWIDLKPPPAHGDHRQ
jgi:acyl-coenzyme A thioesterase PaaI-like protein